MIVSRLCLILLVTAGCAAAGLAQNPPKITLSKTEKPYLPLEIIKSTPAYAEIVLRRAELESELESLLISYTEEFPKVKAIRYEMESLKNEFSRVSALKPAEASKLNSALGKLLVRKAGLETDLWSLRQKYDDNHTDVKRAKRKVEIYEKAVKSIIE